MKLEANKIAETESKATERVIWSAEARTELFWSFFILSVSRGLIRVRSVNAAFKRAVV